MSTPRQSKRKPTPADILTSVPRRAAAVLGVLLVAAATAGAGSDDSEPAVIQGAQASEGIYLGVSPALQDLTPPEIPEVPTPHPARPVPIPGSPLQPSSEDSVWQRGFGVASIPVPLRTFEGMGDGFRGPAGTFSVDVFPPDTDGDVGPSHYVQIVNASVTVFTKQGVPLVGPVPTRMLFSGLTGPCGTRNDGDGLVRYDRSANRWVISQFAVPNGGPFLECIAVSLTGDPTGLYYLYAFQYPNFNDYPKMGVWPDAFYFTYELFSGPASLGPMVCALDKSAMYRGAPAAQQHCFGPLAGFGIMLPADLDGPLPPPPGAPNPVLALGRTALNLWRFHVDFGNQLRSTLTGPISLPVASYTPTCGGGSNTLCILQAGTTAQLDSLDDRLMNRLVYRNFLDHDALVVNHSVQTSPTRGGIRWYEVRNPNLAPFVSQQGTYAPDGNARFMGSAAMDRNGDIALGFSVSGSSIFPQIHYTGRLVNDPPGIMAQGEASIINGTGSQTDPRGRWGDYSSLNVDPNDDCTFFYTQEYLTQTSPSNWHTRVGSFRLPGCEGNPVTSVNAASYKGDLLAPESIVAAFGTALATGTVSATTKPLPTTLGGTSVRVKDTAGVERLAGLFFVSPTQVNYEMPGGTASGTALVTVVAGDGRVSSGIVPIGPVAPGLFSANSSGQGLSSALVLRVRPDGSQAFEPVSRFDPGQNKIVAVPVSFGDSGDRLFLVQYATGVRRRSRLEAVSLTVAGQSQAVLFAGAQGDFVGLDQINAELSRSLAGRGLVDVVLTADGRASNAVQVEFGP